MIRTGTGDINVFDYFVELNVDPDEFETKFKKPFWSPTINNVRAEWSFCFTDTRETIRVFKRGDDVLVAGAASARAIGEFLAFTESVFQDQGKQIGG